MPATVSLVAPAAVTDAPFRSVPSSSVTRTHKAPCFKPHGNTGEPTFWAGVQTQCMGLPH